jgi:hypothetical protein
MLPSDPEHVFHVTVPGLGDFKLPDSVLHHVREEEPEAVPHLPKSEALWHARLTRNVCQLEELSEHPSPAVRRIVAGRSMLPDALIRKLSNDPDVKVREMCGLRLAAKAILPDYRMISSHGGPAS